MEITLHITTQPLLIQQLDPFSDSEFRLKILEDRKKTPHSALNPGF